MAGIYVHIPFCKQACHYCDFHFSTSLKLKDEVIDSICKEIELHKNYLKGAPINSIYFGGGTPSLLSSVEINKITDTIAKHFELSELKEVTLEANPDDLSKESILSLKGTIVNRLSIGIQSFQDNELKYLNRAHDSTEANSSVKISQDAGFENITIDLIYGIPVSNLEVWTENLEKAFGLGVQHLSCYGLTIEEKTVFGNWLKKGKINVVEDDIINKQFLHLMNETAKQGFEQYEISNFAKDNSIAYHNSNYWKGVEYLGIGPGAHSFNTNYRQYNITNNAKYVQQIKASERWFELEPLSIENKINEYIMTSLRTKWGCNLSKLLKDFNYPVHQFDDYLEKCKSNGQIDINNKIITLTKKGKLLADSISSELFI